MDLSTDEDPLFHTRSYGNGRVIQNSGVCVRGSVYNDDVCDYYQMLDEVLEVEYHSESAHSVVVLFKCHWFDLVQRVKVNQKHGLVDIKYKSKLRTNDPYVLASQSVQVYYASYPSMTMDLKDCTDEEIEPICLVIEGEVEEVDNTIYEEDGDEEGEFEDLDDDSDEDMEAELSLSDHSSDDDYRMHHDGLVYAENGLAWAKIEVEELRQE
ncbi:transposase, Ptta/En/Spm [Tanacetum coccineum]